MTIKITILLFINLVVGILSLQMTQADINIPSEYVSEPNFINMIFQNPTPSQTIYASQSGSGSTCSSSSPCSLSTAINKLKKGTKLLLKGGKYDVKKGVYISASGAEGAYIVISSAPNEKAIITSSTKTGEIGLFQIEGSYIIIENLTFQDAQAKEAKGISVTDGGQHHLIIRNNVFNNLRTTKIDEEYGANAILLMGENKDGIKKAIIYGNTITNNVLGYSEALSVAGNCEEIYVLNNFVKDNSNIGIDFYGNAKYCSTPSLDQPRKSVAMYNHIEKSISPYADCAGLYVDGSRDIYLAENTILNSQYGIEIGAEEKNNAYPVKNIIIKNNTVQDNTETGIRLGGYDKSSSGLVRDCEFIGNTISGGNYGVIISKAENIMFSKNKFIGIKQYFINMEFTKTYTKDIKIEENSFNGSGKFRIYGASKTISLSEFLKSYPSNTQN